MALPRHMTTDRLLRVAMTSIRNNRNLLDCTLESLLACVMGCAQLGLEPEPFLGQAYLVPYFNGKKKVYEAKIIPGYRGYLTLARRSGEVQSVTSQVVYENDHFKLQYGLEEKLDHTPNEGDRGKPRGAYIVFRYKDGSHSMDYMTTADIEKIRARSQSSGQGPWVTDWDEMAKKTVIRRHIKVVPLSVEMATAAAAEDKAYAGQSQAGLFLDTQDAEFTDLGGEPQEIDPMTLASFAALVDTNIIPEDQSALEEFVKENARIYQTSLEQVKANASQKWKNFLGAFRDWQKKKGGVKRGRPPKAPLTPQEGLTTTTDPKASPGGDTPPPVQIGKITMASIRGQLADKNIDLAFYFKERETEEVPLEELTQTDGQDILAWLKDK